ncbi:hypothetical protein HMPREF0758_3586 [Serratia odorifera DSM 4582]|uniref:Uncharacterized protein n=1 Tax=Serratia odorifera DSM 4582 TaxID=667129 RepID=D4E5Y6_SEROD|nr:hypothetical protein HMPREF0758_3586 [Serratia odorifera DSM 4582]
MRWHSLPPTPNGAASTGYTGVRPVDPKPAMGNFLTHIMI